MCNSCLAKRLDKLQQVLLLFVSVIVCSLSACNHSKDVRIPQEMQRAMAAEAEATREAKAKVHNPLT